MSKLACIALVAAASFPAFAQSDVHVSPHSDNPSLRILRRDGRYELLGATMVDLISTAYGVKAASVVGGPSWLESDRFDVITNRPDGLKDLLAERFALKIHNDTRPSPAWLLTTGKHPLIKQSTGIDGGCGDLAAEHTDVINGVLDCHGINMAAFAEVLRTSSLPPVAGYISGNPVIDQTNLQGSWDFKIKWTGRGLLAKAGSDGITLFDAIDKQMGLKIEMGKFPQSVLVVDSVNEKPTPNPAGATQVPELKLEFDVVHIKSSTQDHPTAPRFTAGGRLEVRGVALIALIQHAWGLDTYDNDLISGGPKWLTTDRFDIVATATPPDGPSSALKDDDSLRAMLRNMLIDRFKLSMHTEEKPVTVFALQGDKTKLKPADPAGRSKCTEGPALGKSILPQRQILCSNTSAAQFVERLHGMSPGYINRPAVDASGIKGEWDFSVTYSAPNVLRAQTADGQSGAEPSGAISLFDALEKQLGLKLATEKRSMPVFVIDHVAQNPTEN